MTGLARGFWFFFHLPVFEPDIRPGLLDQPLSCHMLVDCCLANRSKSFSNRSWVLCFAVVLGECLGSTLYICDILMGARDDDQLDLL